LNCEGSLQYLQFNTCGTVALTECDSVDKNASSFQVENNLRKQGYSKKQSLDSSLDIKKEGIRRRANSRKELGHTQSNSSGDSATTCVSQSSRETQFYEIENILKELERNQKHFDFLRLDFQFMETANMSDLLRALINNKTIKCVVVEENFFRSLNSEEKARIILEMVGGLPKLQKLSIRFPAKKVRFPVDGKSKEDDGADEDRPDPCTNTTITNYSSSSLLYSVLRHAKQLRCLEVRGLTVTTKSEGKDFAKAIEDLEFLKIFSLVEFFIEKEIELNPLLESVYFLPLLTKIELRLKSKRQLPGVFLESVCQSESLKWLVLFNVEFDQYEAIRFCKALELNSSITRLELWKCQLESIFAGLLRYVVNSESCKIETLIITNIEMSFSGHVVGFLKSLDQNQNRTLKHITLIGDGTCCEEICKVASRLMQNNNVLESINFHCDEVDDESDLIQEVHSSLLEKTGTQISTPFVICHSLKEYLLSFNSFGKFKTRRKMYDSI